MEPRCSHCGRDASACPGGLWWGRGPVGSSRSEAAICVYCARTALRAFGDFPLPDTEPVRLPIAGRLT